MFFRAELEKNGHQVEQAEPMKTWESENTLFFIASSLFFNVNIDYCIKHGYSKRNLFQLSCGVKELKTSENQGTCKMYSDHTANKRQKFLRYTVLKFLGPSRPLTLSIRVKDSFHITQGRCRRFIKRLIHLEIGVKPWPWLAVHGLEAWKRVMSH